MKQISFNNIEEIISMYGYNSFEEDEIGIKEFCFDYNIDFFKGSYKEIILDNFKIGFGNSIVANPTKLYFDYEPDTVEMHFTLAGSSTMNCKNYTESFTISEDEHNIYYSKNMRGNVVWNTQSVSVFEVNLKPDYFEKYLPNQDIFNIFRKSIQSRETTLLNKQNYYITPQMHLIIQEIMNCNRKGVYKKMYLESKVLELLLLQIEQIQRFKFHKSFSLAKIEIEKMNYAKEIILDRIDAPLSLNELAKKVNTNDCTLKKNFKRVFGTTVFGFLNDTKLEEAKNLIIEQDITINEIAHSIGYKNQQHFSKAFRKKYGVNPSVLRKNRSCKRV